MAKWAVYRHASYDDEIPSDDSGWLVDTGVGGTYSHDVNQAQWFDSSLQAVDTLIATNLVDKTRSGSGPNRYGVQEQGFYIVRVR